MDLDAGRLQLQFQPRVWALDPQVVDGIEAPALGRSTPGHGRQHPDDNGQALTDTLILASPRPASRSACLLVVVSPYGSRQPDQRGCCYVVSSGDMKHCGKPQDLAEGVRP